VIRTKRIYDDVAPEDGFRVLVDRLWPRGVTKQKAAIDLWAKDVAPSTEIRRQYHSGVDSWPVFEAKYQAELLANPGLDDFWDVVKTQPTVTLLSAVRSLENSHVTVLTNVLREILHDDDPRSNR